MTDEVERYLPLKPAHFHILLSVVDGSSHGYGIRRQIEERTDGRIMLAAGTLYETIQRLEGRGLIAETESEAEGTSRWRFYAVTPLGKRVLDAEVTRLEADVAAARSKLGLV